MSRNMGTADRVVRSIVALLMIVVAASGIVQGAVAAMFGIVAVVLLATSATARCPMYLPLHRSTRRT